MEKKSYGSDMDAIALLTADHKKVQQLFMAFEDIKDEEDMDGEKADLVMQICMELTIHSQVEEEIFYPAVRNAIAEEELIDQADVEHDTANYLISQLQWMGPGDNYYDAKVCVLADLVNRHIEEEQAGIFAQARVANLDLQDLGRAMQQRKDELMDDIVSPSSLGQGTLQDRRHAERRQSLH